MAAPLSVLVVPNDPVLGALMAELVRLSGYAPQFQRADESVLQALDRIDPRVVLLDCDHAECSDDLLTLAASGGAAVVFFSGARSAGELERIAQRHGVSSFILPNGPRLLESTLRAAIEHGAPA